MRQMEEGRNEKYFQYVISVSIKKSDHGLNSISAWKLNPSFSASLRNATALFLCLCSLVTSRGGTFVTYSWSTPQCAAESQGKGWLSLCQGDRGGLLSILGEVQRWGRVERGQKVILAITWDISKKTRLKVENKKENASEFLYREYWICWK